MQMPQLHCFASFIWLFAACCLSILPCFGAAANSRRQQQRKLEVRLLDGYKSPLDEGFPNDDYYYSSSEKITPNDFDGGEEGQSFGPGIAKELPLCQRECLEEFSQAAKAAIQSNNNFDRYKGVCDHYNQTVICMDKLDGNQCANQETFHVMTSGIRYICIEQRKAFEAVIECVDAQATEVEKECEHVCHVKERLAHWAVQSGILDNFMQGALSSLANGESFTSQIFGRDAGGLATFGLHRNAEEAKARLEGAKQAAAAATAEYIKRVTKTAVATRQGGGGAVVSGGDQLLSNLNSVPNLAPPLSKRLTPDFMRAFVQDGCELVRCQLICLRVKFDAKCGGSAGTLISEAFVRPISQAQEFLSYGSIAPFMGAFLPHQCDFMVKKEVLNEFRIPPELDEALHQKFDVDENGAGGKAIGQNGDDGQQQQQQQEEEQGVQIEENNQSEQQIPSQTTTTTASSVVLNNVVGTDEEEKSSQQPPNHQPDTANPFAINTKEQANGKQAAPPSGNNMVDGEEKTIAIAGAAVAQQQPLALKHNNHLKNNDNMVAVEKESSTVEQNQGHGQQQQQQLFGKSDNVESVVDVVMDNDVDNDGAGTGSGGVGISPGDISRVNHVVSRSSPRKGPRNSHFNVF